LPRDADARLVSAIASKHAKGRRFFVVTTNLDSQWAVIWDMGRLESSGSPEALDLFETFWLALRAYRPYSRRFY
jgi:hypothetical protein